MIKQIKRNRLKYEVFEFLNTKLLKDEHNNIICYYLKGVLYIKINHSIKQIRIMSNIKGSPRLEDKDMLSDFITEYFNVDGYYTIHYV